MGEAELALRAAAALPHLPVLRLRLVVQARAVVEEVLPRARLAARAEALELVEHVVGTVGLDPSDDLVLARACAGGDQVHERVRVGRDEVHRLVRERLVGKRRAHRRPPAARQPRVARLRAPEHPDPQVELAVADLAHEPAEPFGPGLVHPPPVTLRAAAGLGDVQRLRVLGQLRRAHQRVQLVPLELVGDQRRDRVVEVRRRGEQHRERAGAGVIPAPPPRGRLLRLPVLDPPESGAREGLGLLAHDDPGCLPDRVGQAAQRVQERAQVRRLDVVRERVQARVHRGVRRLQDAQQRLTGGTQQRRVRAVVELDLVRGQPGGLAQRPARRSGGDAQSWDGHEP